MSDKIVIVGGGTFNHVSTHLALAAPAFGNTARQLAELFRQHTCGLEVKLLLTKMADHTSNIVTNDDLFGELAYIAEDQSVKAIIMNAAVCDFQMPNPSPTGEKRLSSSRDYPATLQGVQGKAIKAFRDQRPDVLMAGFKTTSDASKAEMMGKGFMQIADSGVNFCLANDVKTRINVLLVDDGTVIAGSRDHVLKELVYNINHEYTCRQWGIP